MKIFDENTFGKMIRNRRKALGLQQRELALTVGVGERFIVELERGKSTCQLGKALAVARALGIQLSDGTNEPRVSDTGYVLPKIQLP